MGNGRPKKFRRIDPQSDTHGLRLPGARKIRRSYNWYKRYKYLKQCLVAVGLPIDTIGEWQMKRGSWKTTIAGIGSVLTGVTMIATGLAGDGVNWEAAIAAIVAGAGLLFARDNSVTSKQAGAEK